ncbi:MAG TPA: hypothetical protein VEY67_10675 [Candidatus Dormibacteraeota bacterium]|nr:hypothetical protein [Candidatus Dormibacteraeota bacterium]
MARAKRTDRADARRRYRQNQLEQAATPNELGDGSVDIAAAPRATRTPPARPAATSGRPGLLGSFRVAAAPADIRADLRVLPALLRTRAAIIPAVLILGSFVATFTLAGDRNLVAALAFQAFLAPPPMAASFLAGILAPRAGWLLGALAGILAAVCFAIVMLVAPDSVILGLFRADTAVPAGFRETYATQALLVSPLMGMATGAFAGFYRRFLRIATPQQRPGGRSPGRQRRAAARR